MKLDFDVLQAIFWSATYVLIFIYNIRYRAVGIPPIAIASNFAWETTAFLQDIVVYHNNSMIHIAWLFLDALIIITYLALCRPAYRIRREKLFFCIYYLAAVFVFIIAIKHKGMLLSSFVIDLTMAIEYCIYSFNKNFAANVISLFICLTKLIGDLCAWIYYKGFTVIVLVIGILVLGLNVVCLYNILFRTFSKSAAQKE